MVMFATAAHSLTQLAKPTGLSPHLSGRSSINHGNTQSNNLKLFQINEINSPNNNNKLGEKSHSMRTIKTKDSAPMSRHLSGFSVNSDLGGNNSSLKQNDDVRSVMPEIKINDEDEANNYFAFGSESQKKKQQPEQPVSKTDKKEVGGAGARTRNQSVIRMRNVTWFKHTADSSAGALRSGHSLSSLHMSKPKASAEGQSRNMLD